MSGIKIQENTYLILNKQGDAFALCIRLQKVITKECILASSISTQAPFPNSVFTDSQCRTLPALIGWLPRTDRAPFWFSWYIGDY